MKSEPYDKEGHSNTLEVLKVSLMAMDWLVEVKRNTCMKLCPYGVENGSQRGLDVNVWVWIMIWTNMI